MQLSSYRVAVSTMYTFKNYRTSGYIYILYTCDLHAAVACSLRLRFRWSKITLTAPSVFFETSNRLARVCLLSDTTAPRSLYTYTRIRNSLIYTGRIDGSVIGVGRRKKINTPILQHGCFVPWNLRTYRKTCRQFSRAELEVGCWEEQQRRHERAAEIFPLRSARRRVHGRPSNLAETVNGPGRDDGRTRRRKNTELGVETKKKKKRIGIQIYTHTVALEKELHAWRGVLQRIR